MNNLFDLNYDGWKVIVLSIIPAGINIGIFLNSFFFLPQKKINIAFSVFVLFLALSQITGGMLQWSTTEATALLWNRISQALWISIPAFGLLFTLKFTELYKRISYSVLFVFLFLPAIFLEMAIIGNQDEYSIVRSEQWNWVINPRPSLITNAYYGWITGVALLMMILLWVHFFREKTRSNKKYQALMLAIGYSFPFIGGIIVEVTFPLIFNIDSIPLTNPLITIFSLFSIIAVKRYSMLDYSPRHQWRTIIETMNEGVLIVDNSDRIKYANETFCRLVEYDFLEIKGKVASDLFLEEADKKRIFEAIEERMNNRSGQYELCLRTKTGKAVWILVNGSPYLDKRGKVIGSIGVQTDITSQKELERKLQDINSRLISAQAIAHVGSWDLNFSTNVANWSDEALRIYGLEPGNGIQSFETWISFIHPADLERVESEIASPHSTQNGSSFEHRIIRKDGTERYIHSISKVEFDESGKPIGLIGVCHDITERKENEKKMNELSERLKLATDSAQIGIFDWDISTGEIVWDANMYSLYNASPESGDISEIMEKAIIPEDQLYLKMEISAAMHESKGFHTVFRIRGGTEKEIRFLETRGVILRNEDQVPIRVIGVNWDITEQKRAEEKIRQSEIRIRSFAQHLNKVQEEERAHLAREIHDELGQRLVGIKFELSSFLHNRDAAGVHEKIEKTLNTVDELIQSLRKIATELRPGILDTLGLASSIEWLAKEFGRKTGILPEIEIDMPQQKFDKGISICFFRICQEALTNISKHSGADKIKISITQKNDELTLLISDNGKGMSNDVLKNPFSMGLLGMQERAKNISGHLQIKSRSDQGTVIQLKATIKHEKDIDRR